MDQVGVVLVLERTNEYFFSGIPYRGISPRHVWPVRTCSTEEKSYSFAGHGSFFGVLGIEYPPNRQFQTRVALAYATCKACHTIAFIPKHVIERGFVGHHQARFLARQPIRVEVGINHRTA